ncbi:MAG: hypothetical protein M1831_004424 [Alyxoria varia]|nr:MAG: hypothetical protein M1831_004424 [Alyxoria varia]
MNCPSRVDDTLPHPEWNQNPPSLAPDATTVQDLNGIVNARVRRSENIYSDAQGGYWSLRKPPEPLPLPRERRVARCGGDGGGSQGWSILDSGHHCCVRHLESGFTKVISKAELFALPAAGGHYNLWSLVVTFGVAFGAGVLTSFVYINSHGMEGLGYDRITPELPTTEKRASPDECTGQAIREEYDLPLHIGALIIILFVSSSACSFPLFAIKFPRLRIPASFLFAARHFGTGVLLATAFVHLLPTAFGSLLDPCLGDFWTTDYPAMPGAITLCAVFFVTVAEMVFSPARLACACPAGAEGDPAARLDQAQVSDDREIGSHVSTSSAGAGGDFQPTNEAGQVAAELGHRHSFWYGVNLELSSVSRPGPAGNHEIKPSPQKGRAEPNSIPQNKIIVLTPEQRTKKKTTQVTLLEVGILFHSVFIGMAISVSTGTKFIVLLVAIAFHRLATNQSYRPDSTTGLLVVGIMNAISSGLLVFTSLVELMAPDFLSDESWTVLRGPRRVRAFLLVFFGGFAMSLVGAWA